MSENWDFYPTSLNNRSASIYLDLGIASHAPLPLFSVRLTLFVKLKNPTEHGLTTQEEAKTLWDVEHALLPAVTDWGALFVGRVTVNGRRDFFFYAKSEAGFDDIVSAALAHFGYQYSTSATADPNWEFYTDILFPSPADLQGILNRRVLQSLKENGDDLSQPRRIHHWLYFDSPQDRALAAQSAGALGFGAHHLEPVTTGKTTKPFGLQIHRIDSASEHAINAVTSSLVKLAEDHSGTYDGWESQVVKPGEQPTEDAPPPNE